MSRHAGLRNDELVHLRTANVDLEGGTIHVVGKGRKARTIPIPARLVAILDGYLTDVRPELEVSPFLFASPPARWQAARMSDGCPTAPCTPRSTGSVSPQACPEDATLHRCRHAYATGLLRAGVSLEHIKRLLDHASITTTSRYLHLDLDDLSVAVNDAFDA